VDAGDELLSSTFGGTTSESINLNNQAVGTYFAQVYQYSGESNYTLRLSNTQPSNLIVAEDNFGTLGSTSSSRTGFVGNNDTSDIYQFSLSSARTLSASLSGLSADADLRIIRDANSNGIADAGDEIIRSAFGGNTSESITQFLAAGDYFAQVYQFGGETSYNLGLSAV
jgi:hypothetical protein